MFNTVTRLSEPKTIDLNTLVGSNALDNMTLTEIEKLNPAPTLMIEHLNESQLHQGLDFIFAQAAAIGITFAGAALRKA